ncbi:Threonylcarbamoyl-AMP synthase [Buchnera aphidicola (Thelaxes suberi)]|uniref:L-threonylcarbamoyladenylate synthase n=1 Tax=Buchnera aphidicola TaxID=9 RepID=UPI003464D870
MKQSILFSSTKRCLNALKKKQIIAYPTESVFGLGCDPDSKKAVLSLLDIKKRSINKGLILISAYFNQLNTYIEKQKLSLIQKKIIKQVWPGPLTLLLPKNHTTPEWITGNSVWIAARVTSHPSIRKLCKLFKKPIISTSANLSGSKPCYNQNEIINVFGSKIPILKGFLGYKKPSCIVNIFSGKVIRYG